MNRDSRRPSRDDNIDEAAIAHLIREVVAGWTMPSVRLDAPSWRDRVRSPRARGLEATRRWLGRVGQAASTAVALTVIAALVAVVITRPPTEPGTSPEPSDRGGTPGPSTPASAPLPKLLLDGD